MRNIGIVQKGSPTILRRWGAREVKAGRDLRGTEVGALSPQPCAYHSRKLYIYLERFAQPLPFGVRSRMWCVLLPLWIAITHSTRTPTADLASCLLPVMVSEVPYDNALLPFSLAKSLRRATLAMGGSEPGPSMSECPVISTSTSLINMRATDHTTDMEISGDALDTAIVDKVSPEVQAARRMTGLTPALSW